MIQEDFHLNLHDKEDSEDAKEILKNLIDYNSIYVRRTTQELTLTLKNDNGDMIAGLTGHTHWGWLFIKLFWVDEKHRGKDFGSHLLHAAEQEALKRGCHSVWLDTFSFQAPQFYQKHGYEIFGTLDNYPAHHQRLILKKKLI